MATNRWNDDEARACCDAFAAAGEDLALRVYTSRLLGQDPSLVLHGGGNTSVKSTARDLLGRELDVLCVKGSGWDLGAIEPPGLPAVRLDAVRELRALDSMSDEHMVGAVRSALLDFRSPNPSVETLLHAFLPHRYVDHTHADAILVLTDQPEPERHVRAALGDDVLVLPWVMPGFQLAKAVADAFDDHPGCTGIVLAKHGLFTFGDTAKQSYERTIALVDRAERYLQERVPEVGVGAARLSSPSARETELARVLPGLRGAVASRCATAVGDDWQRRICDVRTADALAAFGLHPDAAALCRSNPVTPDHVIRTKGPYLYLAEDDWRDPERLCQRVADYEADYRSYYEASARGISPDHMHDPKPVVAVLAGLGIVAMHGSVKAARIAADIAERTIDVKLRAQALGSYRALDDGELAEMEYWPLELAKLGKAVAPPLAGQVALVTGAAGAIGAGIVEVLLEHGCAVLATDVDDERLERVRQRHAPADGRLRTVCADLTDAAAVADVFARCCLAFGGVDHVVPNAGIAHVSSLERMDEAAFRRTLDVNTSATMLVVREAARTFRAQGTGGTLCVQASKNCFAPGKGFAAYSASKAAVLQLARIAAIELAELSVRVNVVNADAVFGDDEVSSRLWAEVGPDRMRARGLDEQQLRDFYRERSLLKVPITPRHVGEAVLWFATMRTPTTGAVLPIDGGLPEAFPR